MELADQQAREAVAKQAELEGWLQVECHQNRLLAAELEAIEARQQEEAADN